MAMRRCLQSFDQQLPRGLTLQAVKLVRVDNNDGIAAMQRDELRSITVRQAHQLTETRLGILQAPTTALRLRRHG